MAKNKQLKQQLSSSKHHSKELLTALETVQIPECLHDKYVDILKQVLPHLGKDHDKIIFAQVMLALKLEGIIGKDLSEEHSNMVEMIKDSILANKDHTESALLVAERILKQA